MNISSYIESVVNCRLHAYLHEGAHLFAARMLRVEARRDGLRVVDLAPTSTLNIIVVSLAPLLLGGLAMMLVSLAWALAFEGWLEYADIPFLTAFWGAWGHGCSRDVDDTIQLLVERFKK